MSDAVRAAVFARDRGVCAYRELPSADPCGLDTEAVRLEYEAARAAALTCDLSEYLRAMVREWPEASPRDLEAAHRRDLVQAVDRKLRARGFLPHRAFWEADHIVPVSEGGGKTGIENRRTLCRPHHLVVTRELRQRLARRPSKAFRKGVYER